MKDVEFEKWKMQNQANLAQYNAENAIGRELFKAVTTAGQTALKTVILINGGSAVALLAFIGNIWNKSTDVAIVERLLNSMGLFIIGVLAGGVAAGLTYLAQRHYQNQNEKHGNCINNIIIICVVIAYIVFLIGAAAALLAFHDQFGIKS